MKLSVLRIVTLAACASLTAAQLAQAQPAGPPPWERTETRDDCVDYEPLRQPLFGETHVHTKYSFDAVSGDVRSGPRDAYSFSKGSAIELPPYENE